MIHWRQRTRVNRSLTMGIWHFRELREKAGEISWSPNSRSKSRPSKSRGHVSLDLSLREFDTSKDFTRKQERNITRRLEVVVDRWSQINMSHWSLQQYHLKARSPKVTSDWHVATGPTTLRVFFNSTLGAHPWRQVASIWPWHMSPFFSWHVSIVTSSHHINIRRSSSTRCYGSTPKVAPSLITVRRILELACG
jgi:hypothetical protein